MAHRRVVARAVCALIVFVSAGAWAQPVVPAIHPPWLNWDVFNRTGQLVDDIHVIVESSNFTPNPADPNQVMTGPFATFTTSPTPLPGGGTGTLVSWSNPGGGPIPAGGLAHIGLSMAGSGRIVDAYWTLGGLKVGQSFPIIYELTRVVPNPLQPTSGDISMLLGTSPAAKATLPPTAMWMMNGVRTWMNVDGQALNLADINPGLNLNSDPRLLGRETIPKHGGVETREFQIDSFFDVFYEIEVGTTPSVGPAFESLLYGEVRQWDTQTSQFSEPYVLFWNLNSQSPEPGTGLILVIGAMAMLRRRPRE